MNFKNYMMRNDLKNGKYIKLDELTTQYKDFVHIKHQVNSHKKKRNVMCSENFKLLLN
ncbi:CYIR protein, partial [Plasmodium cynomolgi strain B]